MVSTGKEGVIYNGLSDWLYEGESHRVGQTWGSGVPLLLCWWGGGGFLPLQLKISLQFLKVLLN